MFLFSGTYIEINFEEKVYIEDLAMPFESTVISNMETIDIKEEKLDQSIDSVSIQMVHDRMNSSSFAAVSDKSEVFQPEIVLRRSPQYGVLPSKSTDILSTRNEVFQSKMENEILKLFEEFDMMTLHDYDQTRVIKVLHATLKFIHFYMFLPILCPILVYFFCTKMRKIFKTETFTAQQNQH